MFGQPVINPAPTPNVRGPVLLEARLGDGSGPPEIRKQPRLFNSLNELMIRDILCCNRRSLWTAMRTYGNWDESMNDQMTFRILASTSLGQYGPRLCVRCTLLDHRFGWLGERLEPSSVGLDPIK